MEKLNSFLLIQKAAITNQNPWKNSIKCIPNVNFFGSYYAKIYYRNKKNIICIVASFKAVSQIGSEPDLFLVIAYVYIKPHFTNL